ncbi:MAG: hypothetical protein HRJ53_16875 [Acidobacteria bacterium Pan2503]|uniref:Uncharacterized protein n=1 Tax=Candidatus Acidiferrum panamense TaxID=2741543 RepID=A0A7V8SYF6_9BACT|nr:hypothetical protein [Candidatus Acidoferrum panamensis]
MFLGLLFATVVVAFAVSALTAWAFTKPLDTILKRIIADAISSAWLRYLQFAILVVGISSGVRVHDLERYLGPGAGSAQTSGLSLDRWVWEIYQTTIESLLGIAWVLLVFFVFALIAYVIVRIGEMRSEQSNAGEPSGSKE